MADELWEDILALAGSTLTQAPDKLSNKSILASHYSSQNRMNGINVLGTPDGGFLKAFRDYSKGK